MEGERSTATVLTPIEEVAASLASKKASDGNSALLPASAVWLACDVVRGDCDSHCQPAISAKDNAPTKAT